MGDYMNLDFKKLGVRLRAVREKRKLTQEELAEMIGMSNNFISNIERNYSIPSLETLVKICNALEITPDYVLLDSIYTAKEYLKDDIARMLEKCSEKDIKLIAKFINLLIDEQKS